MNIAIIGAGYVGLVSAACFSDFGFNVICADRDGRKIDDLRNGIVPIFEPGLEQLLQTNMAARRLTFTTDTDMAIADADVAFITVGTPTRRGDDAADLSYVFEAGRAIAKSMNRYIVVVMKSTVPVGTAAKLTEVIRIARPGAEFDVASNPEFLREGSAIKDFLRPDRVVIGVSSKRAENKLRRLYRPLAMNNEVPIVITSNAAAELIKYAANTYLATRIGFVNQLADLCESIGADIDEVARGMGLDRRIGTHYLSPGPGFGGSCFPKDTLALTATARAHGRPVTIVEEVVTANNRRKTELATRIETAAGGNLKGKTAGILGIAFKADTDDIRDSTSLIVIPELQRRGAKVVVHDPAAMEKGKHQFNGVDWRDEPYAVARNADILIILTEWNEFRGLDLRKIASGMRQPILIDFRNMYSLDDVAGSGLTYHSVGRPTVHAAPAGDSPAFE